PGAPGTGEVPRAPPGPTHRPSPATWNFFYRSLYQTLVMPVQFYGRRGVLPVCAVTPSIRIRPDPGASARELHGRCEKRRSLGWKRPPAATTLTPVLTYLPEAQWMFP